MGRKDKARGIAENLFIDQGLTCKAIAEIVDVSEKTLSDWRTKGNWDGRRAEALAAPHKIRAILLTELQNVASGNAPKIDADSLAKISKVMDTLSDKLSPQIVISVLQALDNFIAENNPSIAIQFLEWHKKFIAHIISLHDD